VGVLTCLQPITVNPASVSAVMNGRVNLAGTPVAFNVQDGAPNPDLLVSAIISGGAPSHLIKTGAGTLNLSGANTYSGVTYLDQARWWPVRPRPWARRR